MENPLIVRRSAESLHKAIQEDLENRLRLQVESAKQNRHRQEPIGVQDTDIPEFSNRSPSINLYQEEGGVQDASKLSLGLRGLAAITRFRNQC